MTPLAKYSFSKAINDKYLIMFMENFNNSKMVKQENFEFSGMTPEAFEIFQKEVDKLFKESKK